MRLFAKSKNPPPATPAITGVLPLRPPLVHPVQTMLSALLRELVQDVGTPSKSSPSPIPGPVLLFARSGAPMAQRLISELTPEQCERIADTVTLWAERLHDERQRFNQQHG